MPPIDLSLRGSFFGSLPIGHGRNPASIPLGTPGHNRRHAWDSDRLSGRSLVPQASCSSLADSRTPGARCGGMTAWP